MSFGMITAEEREKLYKEVWTDPVITVAKRYDMSDNGLRKQCRKFGIPLPPSGYWAKVRAGQKVKIPLLPKVTGELKKHIRNYAIKYKKDVEEFTEDELKLNEELSLLTDETKEFIKQKCLEVKVKGQLRNPHNLITEHIEEIKYRKKRDKALKQADFSINYYYKVKSQYRDNKSILPINISELNIKRAYRILDVIIKTLNDMEGYTRVTSDSNKDSAYFSLMRTTFEFELKELGSKKSNKIKECENSNAKLLLILSPKSWFYNTLSNNMQFKDGKESLEEQIGNIIYNMFVVANKLLAIDELKEREYKREREEQERQRSLEKMRNGELEVIKLLDQAASDWEKAERIRKFVDSVESRLIEVTDEQKRVKILKWISWARGKADWIDPLTEKEDEMLGKSKHFFEMIDDMDS